jgi:di/tricarboxylate transporter
MGAASLAAAFVLGMLTLDGTLRARVDQVADGFPGSLFVVLAGVTYLFAIARNNGTVDWLVQGSVRAVRGRVALVPWAMFFVTAGIAAMGAAAPGVVAIVAPVALGFAARYGISPVLVGLMVANGGSAGSFSPIGIFGSITNGVVERNQLAGNPAVLFFASMAFSIVLGVIATLVFRRVSVVAGAAAPTVTAAEPERVHRLNQQRAVTLVALLSLAVGALFFGLDVGFSAFVVAVILSALDPRGARGAVEQIAWPTVLLVCGIVTYVSLMEKLGTIAWLGQTAAGIGDVMIAALVICYIGGVVSAFASTTGILGALIPLAVPFLKTGSVGAVGLITALAISASVVDSSPFSTSGSLVVANALPQERDHVYRRLMQWGFTMVALAPIAAWLVFVLPGWL